MRRFTRGQALTETTIALPLFLMGLFGIMWAVREGAMSERVQMGVRYGGVVSQLSNPYADYSLYALYATVDGAPPTNPLACQAASQSVVDGAGPRASFFAPASAPSPSCFANQAIITGPESYYQPVLVQDNAALISSTTANGGFMSNVLGTTTSSNSGLQNFFRSPDVATLTECSGMGSTVQSSLEGEFDTTTPTSAPTLMPSSVVAVSVIATPEVCLAFSPPPGLASPSPTPSPTASPSPTPTPSPSPTASPTKAPTASPAPTPTKAPTASPAPTAKPTASPVPTAKPTSTPTTIATKSPTPSPSPTAKGTAAPTKSPSPSPVPTPTAVHTATAAPSPSPTHSPTAAPTASPVPTPTHSPSPAPTASPSPTPAPTASPIPTPTPSPTPAPTQTSPNGSWF
jgi:hypothetical protein